MHGAMTEWQSEDCRQDIELYSYQGTMPVNLPSLLNSLIIFLHRLLLLLIVLHLGLYR